MAFLTHENDLDIRSEFPLLERTLDGHPIIYLDSAATSLKPRSVLLAETKYSTVYTANVHRGKHALSEEASAAFEQARRRIAAFLHVGPANVVFVRNATEGLNLVARGLGLSKSDRVLVPIGEHHSNIVPWMREATITWLNHDPRVPMTVETVVSEIDEKRPRVLAFACASSVTGAVHDMARICRAARERGVLTCVDASQAAPHFGLNVPEIGCDFLTFSGHKLLAPTGIGVLTGKPDSLSALEPLMIGGGSIDRVTESGFTLKEVPYRLEAGTPNVSGALGLAAAVEFLERISLRTIGAHQAQLARTLYETLRSTPGIEMLMSSTEPRLALGSIAIPAGRVSPDDLAVALSDSYGIMVRSGFHCAHPLFDRFGHSHGALRASAYVYNTASDIEAFGEALRKLLRFFGV